jgi:SpoVK/Ycf46/Vps4 family AAA+-type ATPase
MKIVNFIKEDNMDCNDESPKPRKKKVTKSLSNDDYTSAQIKKLLKEALMDNLSETRKQSNMEIDAMVSTMEEFLRSFILIGYNIKNEPVTITHAKSQLDADALYTALARLFTTINNPNGF